jgi:23S rRNA (uracil1939-C5)-methyltransferase
VHVWNVRDNYYDSDSCRQYPSSSDAQEDTILSKEGCDFASASMVTQAVGKNAGWRTAGGHVLKALRGQRENMRKKAVVWGRIAMAKSDQHRQNGSGQVQYEAKAVEDTGARHRDLRVSAPVQVGQEVVLTIDGLSSTGEGVGRTLGFAVFVPGALVGEEIVCTVECVKKNYARAILDRVITPSPERAEPMCDLYPSCGGCQLLHLSYEGQLAAKRQRVVDAVTRIGGLDDVKVHPVIGMADPWRYRNKVQHPVGTRDDELVTGCYMGGTHEVVPTEDCHIQRQASMAIIATVRRLAREFGLSGYDEASRQGMLRHVLVKYAYGTGEAMVVLVTNGAGSPGGRGEEFGARIAQDHPEVKSVIQNVNTARGSMVLGRKNIVLWGEETITDRMEGLAFRISATSFYQVNPIQTVTLYRKAFEYARLDGTERVLDAYCGVGTLSLFLARAAREVYGIESVGEAVRDARANADLNGIDNARFMVGRVEEVLPRLVMEGVTFDVAVVDPPRAGCDPAVLQALAGNEKGGAGVKRIVYVSCNPSTMARDLKVLDELGYMACEIQPVDIFPHTFHVETVVLMSRL